MEYPAHFNNNILVATDLDGTLLNNQHQVSATDYETLQMLGKMGIPRIIATGRNPFSFKRVIPDNFPIDYLVFSSGAGIMDWKTKKIIKSYSINRDEIHQTLELLLAKKVDFTLHHAIPNNHHMLHYQATPSTNDLFQYTRNYSRFVSRYSKEAVPDLASQFVVFIDTNELLFDDLKQKISYLKCIRATSPINHSSLWMELFHPEVSKWNGINFLMNNILNKEYNTLCLGNDFNDLDMLSHATYPMVVDNAIKNLKEKFTVVNSHNHNGFSQAVEKVLTF